jgi:hypothetical protein
MPLDCDESPVMLDVLPKSSGSTISKLSSLSTLITSTTKNKQFHQTPPFRPGGRGSKQLSKALELSKEQETFDMIFCTRNSSFARVISSVTQDTNSVLVQPMKPSVHDPSLFVPWVGGTCLIPTDSILQVKMRKEPGGWKVVENNPQTLRLIQSCKVNISQFSSAVRMGSKEDWDDMVSLESSEFDERMSKNSDLSLFPLLSNASKHHPFTSSSSHHASTSRDSSASASAYAYASASTASMSADGFIGIGCIPEDKRQPAKRRIDGANSGFHANNGNVHTNANNSAHPPQNVCLGAPVKGCLQSKSVAVSLSSSSPNTRIQNVTGSSSSTVKGLPLLTTVHPSLIAGISSVESNMGQSPVLASLTSPRHPRGILKLPSGDMEDSSPRCGSASTDRADNTPSDRQSSTFLILDYACLAMKIKEVSDLGRTAGQNSLSCVSVDERSVGSTVVTRTISLEGLKEAKEKRSTNLQAVAAAAAAAASKNHKRKRTGSGNLGRMAQQAKGGLFLCGKSLTSTSSSSREIDEVNAVGSSTTAELVVEMWTQRN